jgi:secretion/DNA translocation related TadE-like protein
VTSRPPDQRGSIAVLSTMLLVVAVGLGYGVVRVGAAAALRTQAENAADAAALAAADQLALGQGPAQATAAADVIARANGFRLIDCDCRGAAAEVVVVMTDTPRFLGLPDIEARARAEVG